MMKKTLFLLTLVCALCVAVPSQAQLRFGIKAGANITDYTFGSTLKTGNLSGFTGGIMGEFMLPIVGLGVDASLLYARKGFTIEQADRGSRHESLHYLDVPVNLKWKFGLPKIISVFVLGGPSFNFLVGNNLSDQIKKKDFDLALNLGFGVELFRKVQIAAQHGWGLTNSIQVNTGEKVKDAKAKGWSITAAYLF